MSEIVYLNDTLVPLSQASISVLDYGFLYGFGLFETMRAYGGVVFRLESHLERMARSTETLGIPINTAELKDGVADTLHANKLIEARVRITVSAGEGSMTPDPTTCGQPTVLIMASPYQPYPEAVYQKGFSAVISSVRRNSQSPLSRIKSANYLESLLAKQEARAAGADEALRLNERGFLAEASMSNIFLVTDGALKTPGVESGILPGITRQVVLETASRLNIGASEQDIRPEEVFQAQEAFLTNSLMEIMPLTGIDSKTIGSGEPGPVTRRLMAAYRELVLTSTTSGQ
jgi:branched-chain amino acid aminotransferase group I